LVAWQINSMGGMIPRTDDRLIGDNMAVESVNVDLTGGKLEGLPQVEFEVDLSGQLPVVERAYRFPEDSTGPEVWLPLPSRYSSVVRSPLANDTQQRVYWTNPGDPTPWFNTRARIAAGDPPYSLGTVQPLSATPPHIDSIDGGTAPPDVQPIDRSYLYTYINSFGEESAPSPASDLDSGPPDATWTVSGFPTDVPANPPGRNYPPIVAYRIYRTITSQSSGAQFYRVADVTLPQASDVYVDSVDDTTIVDNEILESTNWDNPPDYLDGLVAMPGGFLCGFTTNTVHFSEPDRPHTWPQVYDQSAHYTIVALAVWQQYLMVLTQGFPSAGSGNMPSNIILTQTQVAEPCIARGSVVVDTSGVFYASQNGLIQFTGYGMQNITEQIVSKLNWVEKYHADALVAARHRSQYMAVNGTETGFLIDYAEARLGLEDLSTLSDVVCVWNDEYTGDTLVCSNGVIYEWDCPHTPPLIYRWRSKQFFTPSPVSLGAAQVELDPQVLTPSSSDPIPLDNGDPLMQLPDGINAQFRYYAGPKLVLIMTRDLTKQMEIFRLPKGFKAFDHQAEIVARVPVSSIQLASTLEELKQV
jgi:hypothetical protein